MVDYQRLEGNAGDTSATAAAAPAERSWLPGVGVFFVVVGISVLGFISLQPGPAPPAPPVIAQEESGWKLVHGDVFRAPETSPMLLAVLAGTGVQASHTQKGHSTQASARAARAARAARSAPI